MNEQHSIAEARRNFEDLVHKAEQGDAVVLTRDGERVAVLIGSREYERLTGPQPPQPSNKSFVELLEEWRQTVDWSEMGDPDEVWGNVRDRRPGRDPQL